MERVKEWLGVTVTAVAAAAVLMTFDLDQFVWLIVVAVVLYAVTS